MPDSPEIGFYHLQKWPLEQALPRLLEQALARGLRAVVRVGSEARLESLNAALWTYRQESFLPHGGPADGQAAAQPVYLTPGDDVPNEATLLVLCDGVAAADVDAFDRCADMFDGHEAAVAAARSRWQALKDQGYPLTYWQQTDDGKWRAKD